MLRSLRRFMVLLLAVTLAAGLFPAGRVSAAVTWTDSGFVGWDSVWLQAGQGLDLATNEPGEDLMLLGETITAENGLALIEGASYVNTTLKPPKSGWVTSMKAEDVEYGVVVVELADGGYAQLKFGFGWRSGFGFSKLEIEDWYLGTVQEETAPEPEPKSPETTSPETTTPEPPASGSPLVSQWSTPVLVTPTPSSREETPVPITPPPATLPTPRPAITPCTFEGGSLGLVKEVQLPDRQDPDEIVLTNDCYAWVYRDWSDSLHKVRLSDGQVVAEAKTSNDFHASLAYNPVNNKIYRATWTPKVEVFDGSTGAAEAPIQMPRRSMWDDHRLMGVVADPATGQVFAYSQTQLWVISPNGTAQGPIDLPEGSGGIPEEGAVVRGTTLWLLSQAWHDSPPLAIPVDTHTLQPGSPITLMSMEQVSMFGTSLEAHPTNGNLYLAGQDPKAGPFVAVISKEGKVLKQLFLSNFRSTPQLSLSPGGEFLTLRDPGASGTVVVDREYTSTGVWETQQLFSVFGSVLIVRSSDLSTLSETGTELSEPVDGWFTSDAGKPTSAAYSQDGQYLFITDSVRDRVEVYRVRTEPMAVPQP